MQSPSGLPVKNATLTLNLNQAGLLIGSGAVAQLNASCYTDGTGMVVGAPNPLVLPNMAANYGSGVLPGGTYYVVYTFLTASGESAISPEGVIQLTGTGSIVIQPPASIPAVVTGIHIYVGTASGTETLQGTQSTTSVFTLGTPLVSGANPPASNATVCNIAFNDTIIPYTGYTASLISSSGNAYPGWPQSWQLNGGANGTVNISQGAPLWNGVVVYPQPVLAQPLNHGPQSIAGNLNMTGYNIVDVGELGVGTSTPGWPIDVENGIINASGGFLYDGAAATGQCLTGNGTAFVSKSCEVPVTAFGAACNSTGGSTGTDDTAAFQSAATWAQNQATASGAPVTITVTGNCLVTGVVTFGSGVYWQGRGGTITVPNETGHTFLMQDASNSGVSDLTINVGTNTAGGPTDAAIAWYSVGTSTKTNNNILISGNTVTNSSWGIFLYNNSGTGSLVDVRITGNTVTSPTVFTNSDGIHLSGNIIGAMVDHNTVVNRGDAAISVSTEYVSPNTYQILNTSVVDNILLNDVVGIDLSGASHTLVEGNNVIGSSASTNVNQALRCILYAGQPCIFATIVGNYFSAGVAPNSDTVVIDPAGLGYSGPLYDTFSGNTFESNGSNYALYVRGNYINVEGNTFSPGAEFFVDYYESSCTTYCQPTSNILIGRNQWQGNGTIGLAGNAAYMTNVQIAPQQAAGTVTITNQSVATTPNGDYQTVQVAGCNFGAQASGNVCSQTISLPQQHTSSGYTVNCSLASPLAATGGSMPTLAWTATINNSYQFVLYEQSITSTSSWTTYPNYEVTVTCTTSHS